MNHQLRDARMQWDYFLHYAPRDSQPMYREEITGDIAAIYKLRTGPDGHTELVCEKPSTSIDDKI